MVDWKETIQEILSFGDYTLITYTKGGRQEYNVALHYNKEEKEWDSGNYCYTLESALACCLRKMNSNKVKPQYQTELEEKYDINFYRTIELLTKFKDGVVDYAEEYLEDVCEECEITESEREMLGIEKEE